METTALMRTSPRRTQAAHRAVGVVGAALGAAALAACTSSPTAPTAASGGTVTVTSTTTMPTTTMPPTTTARATPSATTTPPAATPMTTTASSTTTPPGAGSASTGSGTSSGPGSCTAANVRVSAEPSPGGGSAGHLLYTVRVTNTGTRQCTVQGYPGVSLVADGTGKQLGAAADRVPAETPLMRLEPGKSAVSQVQVTQAANFGGDCGITNAAGFRIYLPGETHAAFAPATVKACTSPTTKLLSVRPFNT